MSRKGRRWLQSTLSILLSAVLVVLSPGLECYAGSNPVPRNNPSGVPPAVVGLPASEVVKIPLTQPPLADAPGAIQGPVLPLKDGGPALFIAPSAPKEVAASADGGQHKVLPATSAKQGVPAAGLRQAQARIEPQLRDPFAPKPFDPLVGSQAPVAKGAPDSLAKISTLVDPDRVYASSPEDWRDEVLYSIIFDRFARSSNAQPLGDPRDGKSRHGGDIPGLISQLDYIKNLGVTAIVLNPVILGVPEAYHGYAPLNLLAVDPHLGTMEDFKRLVDEAHKRGLRVIFDMLINHVGPAWEYEGKSDWVGMDQPPKKIGVWNHEIFPIELRGPENFTRHGVINDWHNPEQRINGDFIPNYRHLATDNPAVQAKLIQIACWWLKETDVDGLRIDAFAHINPVFRTRFIKEIRQYASRLGKKNFFILGENSTGVDGEIAQDFSQAAPDSEYNYPEYRRINRALHGQAPTRVIEDSFKELRRSVDNFRNMLRFIDLHDTYRFLRNGEPVSLLMMAMAFLVFAIGIPLVYYGTEQAFRHRTDRLAPEGPDFPADPENRQDMFAQGQYKTPSSAGDKFDMKSPTYRHLKQLLSLREKYPALRRGEQIPRWYDPSGPGLYAFSRIYQGQEVLVVLNTAQDGRSAAIEVTADLIPPGTALVDGLDAGYQAMAFHTAEGKSKVFVEVPPHGARVLVRPAKKSR